MADLIWRNSRLRRDSRVILSNQRSVLTQFAITWFVARKVWTMMAKRATSLFNLFCSNVSFHVFVARFIGATKKILLIFTIFQTVAYDTIKFITNFHPDTMKSFPLFWPSEFVGVHYPLSRLSCLTRFCFARDVIRAFSSVLLLGNKTNWTEICPG